MGANGVTSSRLLLALFAFSSFSVRLSWLGAGGIGYWGLNMLYGSMFSVALVPALALALAGSSAAGAEIAGDRFFQNLSDLCGQTYAGEAIETENVENPFGQDRLVMHVHTCTDSDIRIGFHVGENRSRTWVISKTDAGLQLKHVHLGEDGKEDEVSYYGGMASPAGTEWRQEFPADTYSKELFTRTGLERSLTNVWVIELADQDFFAYALTRPNYTVRVEFDLKDETDTPAPLPK